MKFTPTPEQNKKELEADLQEFQRKLRLLEYFSKNEEPISDNPLAKNKSNFVPPKSNNEHLTVVLESLLKLVDSTPSTKCRSNISKAEKAALNDLKNDESIIIKHADKGGATVIMDRSFYRKKIMELLKDGQNYTQLARNEDDTIMKEIKSLTKKTRK